MLKDVHNCLAAQSHWTASNKNSPNSSTFSSSANKEGRPSTCLTENKDESMGSSLVGAAKREPLLPRLRMVLRVEAVALPTPDAQGSGVGRFAVESMDLGRSGRVGASAIFTAGMFDLNGHVSDCGFAIMTDLNTFVPRWELNCGLRNMSWYGHGNIRQLLKEGVRKTAWAGLSLRTDMDHWTVDPRAVK